MAQNERLTYQTLQADGPAQNTIERQRRKKAFDVSYVAGVLDNEQSPAIVESR
jgi:hypothetical protein